MRTYTSEPGTRLAGRYRLVDQVNAGAGWTYWKATDETLARSVTVLTFATGFPRVTEAVTAARAASRLNDPRFAQVFDVEDADDGAYVVLEWVVGASLLEMLADGPFDPPRAAALLVETAHAIASAHAAGLSHLRLDPACLHWTPGGGVKITGLGIDAALSADALPEASPLSAADAAVADTTALARVLYALLTGCWPGDERTALPSAPRHRIGLCEPRQLRPEVPPKLNAIICHTLREQAGWGTPSISAPAELAMALRATLSPPRISARLSSASAAGHARNCPDGRSLPAFHAA
jgi:serine/threonine protein kinase